MSDESRCLFAVGLGELKGRMSNDAGGLWLKRWPASNRALRHGGIVWPAQCPGKGIGTPDEEGKPGQTFGKISHSMQKNKERWMELCEQAAVEQDSKKLLALTAEIARLLDRHPDEEEPGQT